MKSLQAAAFSSTYKTVWCAGPSIEHVHSVKSVHDVVEDLKKDFFAA
jgi:nitronate monooxygenase